MQLCLWQDLNHKNTNITVQVLFWQDLNHKNTNITVQVLFYNVINDISQSEIKFGQQNCSSSLRTQYEIQEQFFNIEDQTTNTEEQTMTNTEQNTSKTRTKLEIYSNKTPV